MVRLKVAGSVERYAYAWYNLEKKRILVLMLMLMHDYGSVRTIEAWVIRASLLVRVRC